MIVKQLERALRLGHIEVAQHLVDSGIKVGGGLNLSYCTRLCALPQDLTVGGYLDLEGCTSLRELPRGLTVGGYLDLSGCTSLCELPKGLTVGGDLDLSGCTDELKADARRKGIRFYDSVYRSGRG